MPDVSRLAPGHFRQLRPGGYQPQVPVRQPAPVPLPPTPLPPTTGAERRLSPGLTFGLAGDAVYGVTCKPEGPGGAGSTMPPEAAREGRAPEALVELCRLPVMHRILELAQRRLALLAFESQLEAEYRRGHPYASAMETAREVYADPRYEQMINRLKFADSSQCARLLAARIAVDSPSLAVRTAIAEGLRGEFVLVASQLPDEIDDWHLLPDDTVLMDPWGQRQGPARGLLMAAGLESSGLTVQRMFS